MQFISFHICLQDGDRALTVGGIGEESTLGTLKFECIIGLASIGVLILVECGTGRGASWRWFSEKPIWVRWPVYYSIILSILLFGNFGSKQFIYFQF